MQIRVRCVIIVCGMRLCFNKVHASSVAKALYYVSKLERQDAAPSQI